MNTFVINYFLSVFSLFLSENTFKKAVFWFFKYCIFLLALSYLLSPVLCHDFWITEREKEMSFGGLKLKRRGLNWMIRHFSTPFPEPREGYQSPAPSQTPELPNAGASAHLSIPSPETLCHPSVAGRCPGKGCLPGTLNILDSHLCSSPYPSVTLFLTSWQWALFQNYLSLSCLYAKELGNPGSQARLPFWSHILSQTSGSKSSQVHLCSNVCFIQLICWSEGCRFKCPHSSHLSCSSGAGQSPSKSQTTQETKQYIISQSEDKVSLSSRGDLQKAKEIALIDSLISLQETKR